MSDQPHTQLRQLANIVIDAYLNRDQQFIPSFGIGAQAVIYPSRPEGAQDHPGLRTNVWYERSDYEPKVSPVEEEAEDSSKK